MNVDLLITNIIINRIQTKYIWNINSIFYICIMKKDIVAHIRFDRGDYEKIKVKAKELGLSISAYIRMMLLKE